MNYKQLSLIFISIWFVQEHFPINYLCLKELVNPIVCTFLQYTFNSQLSIFFKKNNVLEEFF